VESEQSVANLGFNNFQRVNSYKKGKDQIIRMPENINRSLFPGLQKARAKLFTKENNFTFLYISIITTDENGL
jgi:hypothetical protein